MINNKMTINYYNLLLHTLGLWFIKYEYETDFEEIDENNKNKYIIELESMDRRRQRKISESQEESEKNLLIDNIQSDENKRGTINIKKIMLNILNIFYILFILLTITWKPIYKIMNINHIHHYMANSFMFIIPIQYLIELVYFKSSHFHNTLSLYPKYHKIVDNYAKTILCTSLIASIISIFVFLYYDDIDIYKDLKYDLPTNKFIIFTIICAFDHFFSTCVFFCSIFTFLVVFTIHSNAIDKLSKNIEQMEYQSENIYHLHKHYTELRDRYSESVKNLNLIFSATSILGLFATYGALIHIYLGEFIYDVFDIIDVILYLTVEIVYFHSIYKVRKSIKLIHKTIVSGRFTEKYLRRQLFEQKNNSNNSSKVNLNYQLIENETIIKRLNEINKRIKDNQIMSDWFTMIRITEIPWKNFTILGFAVQNTTFIKKIFAIVWLYILTSPLQEYFDLHI